jgi:6-phosphogluconate dehydrogenase
MQIGMIGLGRMGSNMVRRLMREGHQCVVYNRHPEAVEVLRSEGAVGTNALEDFVARLAKPRAVLMAAIPTTATMFGVPPN